MEKIKKGFTLIELLVVIAIIAILAAVIAPNAFKAIEKSKVSSAISDYKAIKTATLSYYADTGKWPITGANATGFVTAPSPAVTGWNGPYLEKWPEKNPWGGNYVYSNGGATADIPTGAAANHSIKYITIDGLNANAISRLEADLDGGAADNDAGTVRYAANTTTAYIIISEQ